MTVPGEMKSHWFHVLLAVADRPLHGYGIRQDVAERTDDTVRLWPGVLYRSIKALTEKGWIREVPTPDDAPDDARDRRYYGITPTGLEALGAETARLAAYVNDARAKQVPFGHA